MTAPGTPVWFALDTPDPDAARPFYEAVAGWRFADAAEDGGYRMAGPPGQDRLAGMAASGLEGRPPGWLLHLASDDVDADVARVRALGGTIRLEAADIARIGRVAIVADPQGVVFALMQAIGGSLAAFAPMGTAPGQGVWIELATPDPDAAFAFYGALFGWAKAGAMPMGDMGEYAFIGDGDGGGNGGDSDARWPGAVMSSAKTGAPARWSWYVRVPDIDAAVAAASDRGARVLQGPDPIPGGDFSAKIADPQGGEIGLVGPREAPQ